MTDRDRLQDEVTHDERFRRLVEMEGTGLWVFDTETERYVYANAAMRTIRGYDPQDPMSATSSIWTRPTAAFIQRVYPERLAAYRAGERRHYFDELAQTCKDGSVVWVEAESYFHFDDVTGHLLICGISRRLADIGKATLLDELQQLGKIGAWSVDPVTGDGRWTPELQRIYGVDEMQDMSEVMDGFDPPTRAGLEALMRQSFHTGEPASFEGRIVAHDGVEKWVQINIRPVVEHGKPTRIRGTTQDITDLKRAELALEAERARLRASEEQYRALVENLEDVVFQTDTEGRIVFANRTVCRFGYTPDDLVGRRLPDLVHEDDRAAFASGEAGPREVRLLDKEGVYRVQRVRTRPLVEGGRLAGITGVFVDLTQQRETEQQLRAVQKMEAIGRLAGGVAHDFNNLLSVILSYTNLVADALPSGHELQEDLAEILGAGRRAESLTRQLLAFSRRQLLHSAPLHLDEVVDTIGNMLRRLIGEDIELRTRRGEGKLATKVDRGQLEQVILNLVVNARDAMPDGGRITITTEGATLDADAAATMELAAGAYVKLSVHDTGTGMDAGTLGRIFEPFFTTKGVGKGTGLGLAMAYGIVRQSGGAIVAESEPGAGTTMRIYLPRYDGPMRSLRPEAPESKKARGHETLLVVEDEEKLRAVVKRILGNAGYDVLLAASADEALGIAKEEGHRIDLVFTDVVMPGMNGGELAERLAPLCPKMKVIFTSGYTDEKLARRGVGEHCFIAKPYHPAHLTETIREVLDSAR